MLIFLVTTTEEQWCYRKTKGQIYGWSEGDKKLIERTVSNMDLIKPMTLLPSSRLFGAAVIVINNKIHNLPQTHNLQGCY